MNDLFITFFICFSYRFISLTVFSWAVSICTISKMVLDSTYFCNSLWCGSLKDSHCYAKPISQRLEKGIPSHLSNRYEVRDGCMYDIFNHDCAIMIITYLAQYLSKQLLQLLIDVVVGSDMLFFVWN